MKRYISIILIPVLCLAFASCSVKDKNNPDVSALTTEVPTTSLPKPDLGFEEYSKDFTDENGRVVYTVKAVLPKITGNIPETTADYLNGIFYGIFESACDSAEINIGNAAAFMDAQNSQNPWSRSIDYSINLSDGQYFSFTVKEYFSMFGSTEVEPSMKGYVFDIVKGVPCTLYDFTYENHSYDNVKQILVDNFICKDVSTVMFDGKPLTEEENKIVHDVFDSGNFYLTDKGIGFYLSMNSIDPNRFGTLVTLYTWQDIAVVLKK